MNKERIKGPEFEASPQEGSIEVICGCMFSGKSTEFIRRIRRAPHAGHKVQAFKPKIDVRRGDDINTQDGESYPATTVESSIEILELVHDNTSIVAVDEGNFFDNDLPVVCRKLADSGKRVIVAGLDTNFRGEAFGPMGQLLPEADKVDKLHAFCSKCGGEATKTQRMQIIDGKRVPSNYDDETIMVGEKEYEARCRHHHEVPGRPNET